MRASDVGHAATDEVQEILSAFPRLGRLVCRRARAAVCGHKPDVISCLPIPEGVWLRPDAYLYSQRFLMGQGMAVTWDNPDVTLTDASGNTVGSHDLLPSTEYRVTALIHNKSPDAPAPGLPVVFTLLSFGAGGPPRQSIGVAVIDLPVRSAPGEPAEASVVWTTPSVPDHYCIEIDCSWPDDAFPIDNLGQHNTVVRSVSPDEHVRVEIPIFYRPDDRHEHRELEVRLDGYRPTPRPLLRQKNEARSLFAERVRAANLPDVHPANDTWAASVTAHLPGEAEGEASAVFEATVPSALGAGAEERFNVSAWDGTGRSIGGVTVILQVG